MKLFIQYSKYPKMTNYYKKKFEFIDLSTSGEIPRNLVNNTFSHYHSVTIKNENEVTELLDIFQYLYENGGVYIKKSCSPELFIKKNEMVIYDVNHFSCIKNSPTLKKILSELTNPTMDTIIKVFNKHTNNNRIMKYKNGFSLINV
uniref:Uncharacterized protein n=1 Tax=viral metagenome TaxID=1070528 RepID=A0A6C0HRU0_9ZZZZ